MRLRKRVKVLEGMVADLIRKNETLQGRIENLEDSVDNSAPKETNKSDELDYKGVIDEWLNGKADK